MSNTVDIISNTITGDALWSTVGTIVPIALTVTLFALGFYLVKRQMKKVSKGKGGM